MSLSLRIVAGLAALAALTLPGGAATKVRLNTYASWDAVNDGARHTYTAGGFTLRFAAVHKPNPERDQYRAGSTKATLTITAPDGRNTVVSFEGGTSYPRADFGLGRLDPDNPAPQVILATYSGGAHCCTDRTIVILKADGWKTAKVPGGEDGETGDFPKDVDHDGRPDFVLLDTRFVYQFACYACGAMPPMIFDLKGDAIVDVSTSSGFAKLYRDDMKASREVCRSKEESRNGYCAVFVADAARLGQFEKAWPVMIASHNPHADWDYPDGCKIDADTCPKASVIHYKLFAEALARFLMRNGFITKDQADWAVANSHR